MGLNAYSASGGRDSWKSGLLSDQATTSTRSFQLPWPQAAPPSHLQGSTTRSSYSIAEHCLRDSSSALSLLSNKPWGSRSQTSDLGVDTTNGAVGVDNSSDPFSRYSCPSWEFEGDEGGHSLHEMPSDMGPPQISHSHSTHSPYSRDPMNWSL